MASEEENPAMGWRALRVALERDGLLKVQARALLEAAGGRTLNVMFPMVSEPWEFDAAKAVFEGQLAFLKQARKSCCPKRSAMARCWKCRRWPNSSTCSRPRLSFLSIGTNDLTQFLFAGRSRSQSQAGRALRLAQPVDPALPDISMPAPSAEKAASAATAPAETPNPDGAVVLTATDNVWVKVYDADNKRLYEKEMVKGDSFTVPQDANKPMIVTGRPQVLTVTVGGKEVPALGPADKTVADLEISAKALLARVPAPAPAESTASTPAERTTSSSNSNSSASNSTPRERTVERRTPAANPPAPRVTEKTVEKAAEAPAPAAPATENSGN
jgi:hypothetical protein